MRALAFVRAAVALSVAAVFFPDVTTAQTAEPAAAGKNGGHDVGRHVFEKWCTPCHGPGPGHPGTTALEALYNGSKPAVLEDRTDLTPAVIKQFVRQGVSVMPFFRKTEISDAELDALAAYLSNRQR